MGKSIIINGKIIHNDKILIGSSLVFSKDKIIEIKAPAREEERERYDEIIDAKGNYVSAGFIDLHIHGGGCRSFSEGNAEAVLAAGRTHSRYGTTALLPTIETTSIDKTLDSILAIRQAKKDAELGDQIVGIHIEGPFISPEKAGAQEKQYILSPDKKILKEILSAGEGMICIVTLAPELAGANELIEEIIASNGVVAIGHSSATSQETIDAIQKGASYSTHTYNAMSGFHHREPGVVGTVLADERVRCEIICDGVHADPVSVRLLIKAKSSKNVILVTDCVAALDCEEDKQGIWRQKVSVDNESVRLADGTLAGSVLTMNKAVKNIMEFAGIDLPTAIRFATINPARVIGQDNSIGSLDVDKKANIIIFDDNLDIQRTILSGKTLFQRA